MASLQWTDDEGAETLVNVMPDAASVFTDWVPFQRSVGPRHTALGTGIPYKYGHRTDYGATFRLEHIAMHDADTAARLLRHLENGGSVTVNTDDMDGNVYTAYIAEDGDTDGALTRMGAPLVEYVLDLKLINAAGAPMTCLYDVQPTREGWEDS